MYDSIIIGGGPAGMTAAIYLARKKMKIILLTQDYGGQIAKAAEVDNYPGLGQTTGAKLVEKFNEHLKEYKIKNKTEEVKKILYQDVGFEVETKNQTYQAKTLIICSGKTPRHLDVPGEEEFIGKGVSFCATCDAPLFKDKVVAVVGGGNSALDAAIELERYAKQVYIVNISPEIQGDAILKEKFENSPKSKIINNAKTTEIYGDQFIQGLKYEDQNSKELIDLSCEGIFVEIGWTPSSTFLKDLVKLNQLKEIEVDKNGATETPGIFAAGDVTDTPFKQIIIAAGEGAKAALSAWKYLIMQKPKRMPEGKIQN